MSGYREEVVEKSMERLRELEGELKALDAKRKAVEEEYGQVKQILVVMKAEGRVPLHTRVSTETAVHAPEREVFLFEYPAGRQNRLHHKTVHEILTTFGTETFRTGRVARIVAKEVGRTTTEGALGMAAGIYLKYLISEGLAERVGHGRYRLVKRDPPSHDAPKERDVVDDDTELHVAGGVVTCEKPGDRGYGRK